MYLKAKNIFPMGCSVTYNNHVYKVIGHSLNNNKTFLNNGSFIHPSKLTRHKPVDDIIDAMEFIRNWNSNNTTTNTDSLIEWTLSGR